MRKKKQLPQVEPVRLKPVLGIRPGVYLLVLYSVILFLAIFLVGFLPGIVRGGRYVDFSSPLSDAGLYVDGTYQGSADYQYFIPSGTHEVEVRKADIVTGKRSLTVDHPVFLTWLFHRTMPCPVSLGQLSEQDKRTIIAFDLQEIVRYSSVRTWDNVTPYPDLFTHLARDVEALDGDRSAYTLAAHFITSKEMLDDAEKIPSNDPLCKSALEAAQTLFGDGASHPTVGLRRQNADVETRRTSLDAGVFSQPGIAFPAATFTMGREVEEIWPSIVEAGVSVTTEPFAIATTPVTMYQWACFLEAHPEWAKAADPEGADSSYLAGEEPSTTYPNDRTVVWVSRKAGKAFCSWLSDLTGKNVYLPTEAEWTLAAMAARDKGFSRATRIKDDGSDTPSGMLGGYWELTSTPFIPLARATDYAAVQALADSWNDEYDGIVKGGSADSRDATRDTVGAVAGDATSDTIALRIAWKESNGTN